MLRIPKCQCIEEPLRIGIRKFQSPTRSAICGFVDARLVALAAAKQIGSPLIHCMYAAKIKLLRARN